MYKSQIGLFKRGLCLSVLMAMTATGQGLMVKEYQEKMASPQGKPWMVIYLRGVGDGIFWTNTAATMRKQPLFCPGETLSFETSDYVNILNREIEQASGKVT